MTKVRSQQLARALVCSYHGRKSRCDRGNESPRIWSEGTLVQIVPMCMCKLGGTVQSQIIKIVQLSGLRHKHQVFGEICP